MRGVKSERTAEQPIVLRFVYLGFLLTLSKREGMLLIFPACSNMMKEQNNAYMLDLPI